MHLEAIKTCERGWPTDRHLLYVHHYSGAQDWYEFEKCVVTAVRRTLDREGPWLHVHEEAMKTCERDR